MQDQIDDINQRLDDNAESQQDFSDSLSEYQDDIQSTLDDYSQYIDDLNQKAGQLQFPLTQDTIDLLNEQTTNFVGSTNGATAIDPVIAAYLAANPSSSGINGYQVFTSSGTFTVPTGFTKFFVKGVGHGGNGDNVVGSSVGSAHAGAGGGSGGYCEKLVNLSGITTVVVTIGSGTSFGSYFTARDGSTYTGGTATGGDLNMPGGTGMNGMTPTSGSHLVGISGSGAASPFGGAGLSVYAETSETDGAAAQGYGSGGSGAASSNSGSAGTGGAGKAGVLIITW